MQLTDEQIASIIHEAHRAYQAALPLHPQHVMPAPPWQVLTQWQRETVLTQVRGVRVDLDTLGWRATDEKLAMLSHGRWVERLTAKHWTLGEKDPVAKTHPCLVSWSKVSPADQAKTLQAVAIAKVHLSS